MTPIVELAEVHRSFGPVHLLRGVSASAAAGEVVALYGRSGSGKTTILNLIAGLDPIQGGQIRVDGKVLAELSTTELAELRRTRMGFIFQSYGLLSHLSAAANVEFGLRLAGCPRREWAERTQFALEAVGLTKRASHRPAELSGGERQRVSIARVLAIRPRIVLADEPTGALDHATGVMVTGLLVRYARDSGATVWIATHDRGVAGQVDRAYRIHEGRLAVQEGT